MKASLIATSKPIKEVIKELDDIFMEDNTVVPVGYEDIADISLNDLRAYCHHRGIYAIITKELVEYLRPLCEGKTIEIGAGNGTLGRALGIITTDSKMQNDPAIKLQYQLMGQPTIQYPSFVEEIEGIDAIDKYKPKTVIGCWITHRWRDDEMERAGNYWAPDEEMIMRKVDTYIMIGNMAVHMNNRLFNGDRYNVSAAMFPWLASRSSNPEADCIFTFTKKEQHGI